MGETGETGTTNARLSRLETKYDELARVIDRVEQNQKHAEELNALRFKSLDQAVGQIGSDLKGFMDRIDKLISGETQTARGKEMLDEYNEFREDMTAFKADQSVRNGRIDLVAKVVWGVVGANVFAIVGAIIWLASGNHI